MKIGLGTAQARDDTASSVPGAGPLGRLRLRYLTAGITAAGSAPLLLLAAVHPRGASVLLAGAALILAHGLFWLLVLRHNRRRLRQHGFRW